MENLRVTITWSAYNLPRRESKWSLGGKDSCSDYVCMGLIGDSGPKCHLYSPVSAMEPPKTAMSPNQVINPPRPPTSAPKFVQILGIWSNKESLDWLGPNQGDGTFPDTSWQADPSFKHHQTRPQCFMLTVLWCCYPLLGRNCSHRNLHSGLRFYPVPLEI